MCCKIFGGLILHTAFYTIQTRYKWNWKLVKAIIGSLCIEKITLSQAQSITKVFGVLGWSEVRMLNNIGERMFPWGTPALVIA